MTLGQDGLYLEDRDYTITYKGGPKFFAACHLCKDKVKNTQFIIKRLSELYDEPKKQEMIRESQILQEINHENVICFYGAVGDLQDNTIKMFLEYADDTCMFIWKL